jgi:hypothetical protein
MAARRLYVLKREYRSAGHKPLIRGLKLKLDENVVLSPDLALPLLTSSGSHQHDRDTIYVRPTHRHHVISQDTQNVVNSA